MSQSNIKQKNQKFKISTGIRNNLAKYQESKIFREIVQNAEDAGANVVIIKLDERSYGTDKLFNQNDNLKSLQGPSIIIYNNAVFKDSDWEGIEFIGEGSKKKDMLSIGNFGLGFNSTYHLSDCPQIVSGNKMWFLDPLNLIGEGIYVEDFTKLNYNNYKDQFKPFEQLEFRCDMKSYFNGTIIRLPLRTVGNELKEEPVTIDGCIDILTDFYNEMLEIPIFLKVISSITLRVNSDFYYKVHIKNHAVVQHQRKKVSESLKSIVNNQMKDKTDNYEFNDIISKENQDKFKSTYQLDIETTLNHNNNIEKKEISFIVSQGILVSNQLNELVVDSQIKLISYGGVAIPIKKNNGNIQVYDEDFNGKPFCFLPIGNQVISSKSHIFGYYILSDARSEIQYSCQSTRKNTQEYKIYQWNQFISKQVVPFFYNEALKYMKRFKINLITYFPYKCLVNNLNQPTFESDFSSSTMKDIMDKELFLDHFSSKYFTFNSSVIIKENTQEFIIDHLENSNIKTLLIKDSFFNYLQHNNIRPKLLISPLVFCQVLLIRQLTEYSNEILNYLCSDKKVIESGSLNNIKLLPINQTSSNEIYSLVSNGSFHQNIFIVVPNEIYLLLSQMQANLDYILDLSEMGDGFIQNNDLIQQFYTNIKSIDINIFLNKVNIKSASLYCDKIWSIIESLYSFHSNDQDVNIQISNLPIFKYSNINQPSIVNYTSYNSPTVFSSLFLGNLSNEIKVIFHKLKLIIVKCDGEANRFLSNYDSQEDSINKLLKAIYNIGALNNILSTNEILTLRTYLFNLLNQCYYSFDQWGINNTNLFFTIPLHECIGNPNKQFTSITLQSTCVKFNNIKKYEIIGKELILLDDQIYDLIPKFPTKQFIKREFAVYLYYLIPFISNFSIQDSIDIIINFINNHLSSLKKDPILPYDWILTCENNFISLRNLYHLTSQEIKIFKIIHPQYVVHEKLLDVSSQLFKYQFISKISPNEVINLATRYLQSNNNQEVYQLLLEYFNQFEKSELENFENIKFIPSSLVNTYQGFEPKSKSLSISEVTIIEHKDIKFSIKYPIKFNKDSTIYKYIKDDTDPIFEHWYNLLQHRNSNQISKLNLSSIFQSIYKKLSKIKKLTPKQMAVLQQIKNNKVIWYQDNFIDTNRLYTEGDYKLSPFYYKINLELYKIFESFNIVKKNLQLEDYYLIIKEIQDKNGITKDLIQDKNEITKDLIQMYCYCLKLISSTEKNNLNQENVIKLLPTVDDQLIEFNKVVFSESSIPPSDGYYQLNKQIDFDTVEKLNILKLSQVLQEIHSLSFGQREELVTRLKSIIKDYRVEGFFNEMIQNASDANANQFKMLLDENQYKPQLIKSKDVPNIDNYLSNSLVLFNNSTFTDLDIQNVQNIGSSYKKKEENSIGFNGLGINSAYNFSNTISILSGKYLMILDPFITHIPLSPSKATGCKYEIKKCLHQYSDYFQPFLKYIKLLNLDFNDEEFNGTIIRLPLGKNNNNEKNISNALYDNRSILELFSQLESNSLYNCMLFTNIDDFEVGHIIGSKYNLLYKTTKLIPKLLEPTKLNNKLDEIPIEIFEHNYSIINKTCKKYEEKKFIVGSSKLFKSNDLFLENLSDDNKIKMFFTNYNQEKRKAYGGISFEISDNDGSYILRQQTKSFCYLPFKNIDLPFNVNGFFNVTTSRDIYESPKATHLLLEDILKTKADFKTQQLESFLIYWNSLLIEELITPVFIKTLITYKDNYILNIDQPDVNKFMNLVPNYYQLFPNNTNQNNSIFQRLVLKFYQLSKSYNFNYLLPHPSYYSNNKSAEFLLILDQTLPPPISVLKCFSNYGNIYIIPKILCEQLEKNELSIKPELLSKLINGKILHQDIINNEQYLYEILCYLGLELSNNCQLLKLKNGSVEFICKADLSNSSYRNEKIIYNEEYYNLIKNNNKINKDQLFIDINYSNMLLNYSNTNITVSLSNFNIIQPNKLDFFFKIIHPHYNSFTLEDQLLILEFIKSCFFINETFTMAAANEQHQMLKESKLIPSLYKNEGVQYYSITSLYSFEFKKQNFELIYPLDCFNTDEWNSIFKVFEIRNYLDQNNIVNEFKRLSKEFYSLKDEEIETKKEEFKNRSKYLWNNAEKIKNSSIESRDSIYNDLFNTVLELNIIPTSKSGYFGSKSSVPLLGRISNCYNSYNENLLFTVKYKSELIISYPNNYAQFTNEDVYQNLVNILNNHNQWRKRNDQHDDKIFELLRSNLQYLEDKLRTGYQIKNCNEHQIYSIPIQDSNQSLLFENIIFENLNVTPFFSSLPFFYSSYPNLFRLLGVKSIDDQPTIINRLNQFLHQVLDNSQINSFKLLYDRIRNIKTTNETPILTSIKILKPLSDVFYIDEITIYNRISIDRLWVVNDMYQNDLDIWSIQKLSDLVTESININLTTFKNKESLEFDIFENEFLKDQDLLFLISNTNNHSNINKRILTTEIKYGSIYVKTILKRDNSDISNNKTTDYFYDSNSNILYLNENSDLYSTLEIVFGFNIDSLKNIFNKISSNRNNSKSKLKNEEFGKLLDHFSNSNNQDSINIENNNNKSKIFYKIAKEKNNIASILYDNRKYDEVFIYCNKSILFSIKSVLEYQNINYNFGYGINKLKALSNNLQDLQELSELQINLNRFKSSLCQYSNQDNSTAVLNLSNQYLRRAKSLIHD